MFWGAAWRGGKTRKKPPCPQPINLAVKNQWAGFLYDTHSSTCFIASVFFFRSLPKLSSQDEDGPTPHAFTGVVHFEPIPHDHDFCERVVINVSWRPDKRIRFPLWNTSKHLSKSTMGGLGKLCKMSRGDRGASVSCCVFRHGAKWSIANL